MIPPELAKQIHLLEIRTRRAVDEWTGGAYRSVFKGRGIEFDEVREYTEYDDVRDIDWNVTARMGVPYVKQYVEERELNVLLLVDVSASGSLGREKTKRRTAAEIAAMLAFSAGRNGDKTGLILFSDRRELTLPPRPGRTHALRLIRDLLAFQPTGRGTDMTALFTDLNRTLKKKCVIFLIGDFMEGGPYEQSLRLLNRKHDVAAFRILDQGDEIWPVPAGITVQDAETGEEIVLGGSARERLAHAASVLSAREQVGEICLRCGVDLVDFRTGEDPLPTLIRFFEQRRKRHGGQAGA